MDLNLFENRKTEDNFINQFIEELKNALENTISQKQNKNEKSNVLDEYNIYEKKKIFLYNKSRKSNELAWIMDDNSVCISEDGDGGPISISEIDLPNNKLDRVTKTIPIILLISISEIIPKNIIEKIKLFLDILFIFIRDISQDSFRNLININPMVFTS